MKSLIRPRLPGYLVLILVAVLLIAGTTAEAQTAPSSPLTPQFSTAVAFDVSLPLRAMTPTPSRQMSPLARSQEPIEIRPERGPVVKDRGYSGDGPYRE
jgi:hypothetical protein